MNTADFRTVIISVSPLLPAALMDVLSIRADELTHGQRQVVADILLEALRVHGKLLADGVDELKTILRKAKTDERAAAETADASALPTFE